MPLPRFGRLSAEEQQRIIDAAQAVFAAESVEATYAEVIRAAGISKSTAYNYFDSRDDLLGVVLDSVAERLRAVLGSWNTVPDAEAFWGALGAATTRLEQHAGDHPEDLALIDPAFLLRMQGGFTGWVAQVIDNGIDIGVITVECDRGLLVSATAAVLRAGDTWWADEMRAGRTPDYAQQWALISNLWGAS